MTHTCDLCGESDGTEIEPGIFVCAGCGFVHVKERRDPKAIAAAWSEVYAGGHYSPEWPGVRARLFYVAEWLDQHVGLAGKSVLDIGAGRGFFLRLCRDRGAHSVGLEPDPSNVERIKSWDIACFHGAVEDHKNLGQYDLVTILWTLENCGDALAMLRFARGHLAPGGQVVVATGSRVLVPFKKSYSAYMGTQARDLHCFRWSARSLVRAFTLAGLQRRSENDFDQNDVLLMTADVPGNYVPHPGDDPVEVVSFFSQWRNIWP